MKDELTRRQIWIYSLPALPLAVPTVAVFVLLPTFYIEHLGLGLALTGLILMLARLSDVLTDPLIGRWLDHASPRRFKLIMMLGGLICIPSLLLLVNPPQEFVAGTLFFASIFLYLGWTCVQVPYLTWLRSLSRYSYQRTRIASYREACALLGLVFSASLPVLALTFGLSTAAALTFIALLTLGVGGLLLAQLLWQLPAPEWVTSPLGTWREVFQNQLAKRLILTWLVNGIANGIPAVLFPLYITSVLGGSEADRPGFILLYFLSACLALPIWLKLSQRVEKTHLWQCAMLLAIAGFIPALFLGEGDQLAFYLICILTGAALGADLALPHALQADVADWDQFRYRRRQTGLLFAIWNSATKLALALAAGIALGLLALSGFEVGESQSATPILLIYALLPCVMKAIAITLLLRFPLQNRHQQRIARCLSQRSERS
ncbi:MFS transporter [Nitrincola tapanii]|uniref:MFS transporter n=1 Tax=Nitrincola tapanii TaxID=1708751 RepID=A0A5A9W6E7_9GAMM|nr:MFS transporter [Nitrincola tapanii]KAA0875698.1 MFS transporter [Nitrincola tapanii]